EVRGLLRRSTLRVDGGRRDTDRQARAEPRGAADVERLLTGLTDASRDDLSDRERIDAGAFDRRALHGAEQIGWVHGRETAVAPSEWRADGFDDDNVGVGKRLHGGLRSFECVTRGRSYRPLT